MAESLFILELEFLHLRGGCSPIIVIFVLMLVGTCCFILSASLYVVRPMYRASHWHKYVGRTTQRIADRLKQHVPTSILICSTNGLIYLYIIVPGWRNRLAQESSDLNIVSSNPHWGQNKFSNCGSPLMS